MVLGPKPSGGGPDGRSRYGPKRRNTLRAGQKHKTRKISGAIVKELRSISDAPPMPFYVVVVLVEPKVLFTRNMMMWKREIKARKDEQITFFPVCHSTQLEALKVYCD